MKKFARITATTGLISALVLIVIIDVHSEQGAFTNDVAEFLAPFLFVAVFLSFLIGLGFMFAYDD